MLPIVCVCVWGGHLFVRLGFKMTFLICTDQIFKLQQIFASPNPTTLLCNFKAFKK